MPKPTKKAVELGARYLAMSNICTLDQYRSKIVDLKTMELYVHAAWEDAVTGTMEGMEGGYDDKNETKAIAMVEREIRSFRADINAGGNRAKFWITSLDRERPYWRDAQ